MNHFFSKWSSYLASVPTLLLRIERPLRTLLLFLGIHRPESLVVRVRNGPAFRVRTRMDVWIVKETCIDRNYENEKVQLSNAATVADIGAAFGDFSILAAMERKDRRILAFEPHEGSRALLEENALRNGVRSRIEIHPCAVGSQDGRQLRMAAGDVEPGDYSLVSDSGTPVQVQFVSLARVIALCGGKCDFLKIDCEGGEYEILLNASDETLAAIGQIAMEYHVIGQPGKTPGDLANRLEQAGFAVRIVPSPVHGHLGFLFAWRGEA